MPCTASRTSVPYLVLSSPEPCAPSAQQRESLSPTDPIETAHMSMEISVTIVSEPTTASNGSRSGNDLSLPSSSTYSVSIVYSTSSAA
jgi:hypothetical protein